MCLLKCSVNGLTGCLNANMPSETKNSPLLSTTSKNDSMSENCFPGATSRARTPLVEEVSDQVLRTKQPMKQKRKNKNGSALLIPHLKATTKKKQEQEHIAYTTPRLLMLFNEHAVHCIHIPCHGPLPTIVCQSLLMSFQRWSCMQTPQAASTILNAQ